MASQESSTRAALKLCAILLVLSWLQTVAATPRFIEAEEQRRYTDGQYGVELHTRNSGSGQKASNVNVANLPEILKQYRFNDGQPKTELVASEEDKDDPDSSEYGHAAGLQERAVPQLADIALAVTIDGAVHAIKRENGLWVWSVHDDNPTEQRDDVIRTPLVRSSNNNYTGEDTEDEEIYIIEPHSGGDIYVYHKPTGKMQRLPLSVSQLVDLSPFSFPTDSAADGDGRLFVGRKETKLVGVDLQTGKLVGVFGPEAGWCEWQTLRKSGSGKHANLDGSALREDVDEDSIENRPWDLLYLGRTDYHISIYSKSQGLLQTLQYTSYGPSTLATAAASTSSTSAPLTEEATWAHSSAKDGRYIQPMHDGSLVCFESGTDGLQWTNHFSQPVIAVYDVVFPLSDKKRAQPVLYPHPSQEVHSGLAGLANLPPATFVGRTENVDGEAEFFAMSNRHYPLVAFAPVSTVDNSKAGSHYPKQDDEEDEESVRRRVGQLSGILGSHRIEEPIDNGKTLDSGPEPPLGIDPPPAPDQSKTSQARSERSTNRHTLPGAGSIWNSFSLQATLLLVGSLVLSLLYLRKYLKKQQLQGKLNLRRLRSASPAVQSEKGLDRKDPSLASTSTESRSGILLPPIQASDQRQNGHRTSPSMEKALPALPVEPVILPEKPDLADGSDKEDEGFEGSGDAKDANGQVGKNPKKGRRRKRGKRGGSNQAGQDDTDIAGDQAVTPPSDKDNVPAINGNSKLTAVPEIVSSDAKEAGQVGSLTISEDIIGYGSQGTVVLKGTFQGRAVAVKRLLKDFVTVASHEVQLLQESDSHSNVIRYFYKEQHENFLYIALELCPASLFELIDTPDKFPDLVKAFDPIKAMKQITKGLQHLHRLKIIHRDLKPQNILIAASPSKPSRSQQTSQPNIRMVISDFGLCKKLDLDESSFLQSTRGGGHHAAGSFGYRAPEVLRGEVDANDLINTASEGVSGQMESTASSSTASTSTLAPARSSSNGTGIAGSGRKLTRSIDIFSLGCIFYFVLTMGDHPFGSRYEREVNILNDKITLDGLSVMTENVYEAQELIRAMCSSDPHARPTAGEVTLDPLFWTPAQALHFLCDASDRFEIMDKEALAVLDLEAKAAEIVGTDWLRNGLDRNLVDNLGKYRKYDGGSVRDLMRVLRNKKHHYQDLPENVRKSLGEPPEGFLSYFTRRFPKLVLHVHLVVKMYLADERLFSPYFELSDDS